jgi:hypothetical protein
MFDKGLGVEACSPVVACSLGPDQFDDLEVRSLLDSSAAANTRRGTRLVPYPSGLRPCASADPPPPQLWHDTQLGTDCELVMATDGKTRCLPPISDLAVSDGGYADPECKTPFVTSDAFAPASPTSPTIVAVLDESSRCTETVVAYRAEPRSHVTTFEKQGTDCVASPDGPVDGLALVPIAPTEFVGADLVTE